ncbi:sensor histidine kinase [Streptomyces mirabilis]|uniref:sensor histidine kinase n=1 Tax=Streptomyces mirabilis TaxID=68239 RepID=UPI0036A5C5C2
MAVASQPSPPLAAAKPARGTSQSDRTRWLRPTIRMRLTLLYGGMFMMAGIVLLVVIYMFAASALKDGVPSLGVSGRGITVAVDGCPPLPSPASIHEINAGLNRCLEQEGAAALHTLWNRALATLVGLTAVAFAFGYAMAGRVLSPLGHITRAARRVAGSDLHSRIELSGPDDELKELADTFDEMLDRLDRAFESQRRFVSNASHELRTPLAINRTLLEVQLADPGAPPETRQLGKTLLATNERSERLVQGLLLLARSENKVANKKQIDLSEIVAQALEQTRGEAEAKGVDLRGDCPQAFTLGNGALLERIALNLIQNAVRHNVPVDGWVEVATKPQPGCAALIVSNTGPAVPAYEVENLFEPFRRLRTERTSSDKGVGLGLSIVRSVVRAHDGTITAEPRDGGGLVIHVNLPQP